MSTNNKKKSPELKKHVGLIHSTNKLSLLERKIANALLYYAYNDLLTKNEHSIHISSLCILIGYNSKDDKTIKKALMSLMSTVLEWNLLEKDKQEEKSVWVASTMLADAKIEGPICTYSYSNRMRELCYHPEFYGQLDMQALAMFKSTYGLALYENCIRYQSISQTPWFDITVYRKLMGVSRDKYAVFRDLNRRVIKPAVAEVNQHSPINIKPEFKKGGRAIVAIRFQVSKRSATQMLQQFEENNVKDSIANKLKNDYGLSALQLKAVMEKYEVAYLLEKMALIKSSPSYQEGRIKNLASYLEKALLRDYKAPKSSKINVNKLRIKSEKEAKDKALYEEIRKRYLDYQIQQLPKVFEDLNDKEKAKISREFDDYISKTVYSGLYTKEGLANITVRDRLAEFIMKYHSKLLSSLLSLEEFCQKKDL